MLRQRLLTALALTGLVVCAIFLFSDTAYAVFTGVMMLIGAWEWSALAGVTAPLGRALYVLVTATALGAVWYTMQLSPAVLPGVLTVAVLWWLLALLLVLAYRGATAATGRVAPGYLLAGLVVLVAPFAAFVALRDLSAQGPWLVLFLLLLIAMADSGAFFAGRRWGRNKLAPAASPGKTWEGVGGAFAAALAVSIAAGFALGLAGGALAGFVVLCALTVVFSIVGDLFESIVKRRAGMKDSGRLLPGHGGMLDRIDSLTAAAPAFTLGLLLTGAGQ